jgi:anhydro-N-acetylmuramic acid kinase
MSGSSKTWLSAIGLMSGTSLDGVDAALISTDGERVGELGPTAYRSYTDAERRVLIDALAAARNLSDRTARPPAIVEAETLVTLAHADVVEDLLATHSIDRGCVAVVAFHGQTIVHRPEHHLTVQIGDGRALAARIGIPVVYDFRAADVAAGGEGAPLVPAFHRALVSKLGRKHPIAVLNLGGVGNITFIDHDNELIACDTGPGNALIDDFVRMRRGEPFDRDGALAAQGKVDVRLIEAVLERAYFDRAPPKSLDRDAFADLDLTRFSVCDGAATLTALTAACVARVVAHFPSPPAHWIVAGGGAHNRTLMKMLSERLAPASIETADMVGWSSDALEAQAFAYLAVRALKGLPITFPRTTGAPHPMTGGLIAEPRIASSA